MNKSLLSEQVSLVAGDWGRTDALRASRCLTFLAIVLVIWISLRPFADLTAADFGDGENGKLAPTYITLGISLAIALALTVGQNARAFRSFMTPAIMALCGWMLINTFFSHDFALSFQRLALTGCVFVLAACLLLLPDSQADLDHWLGAAALTLLAVCYLGILLTPKLATHTVFDTFEVQLAGDWRGTFGHKNVAAPIMAMLVFVGLYLVSRRAFLSGIAITILSSVFLVFSEGKSAMALCVFALALSFLVNAVKTTWLRGIIVFVPLLMLNLLTVGSVLNDSLAEAAKLLPLDTTYTGRSDVWEFALTSLSLRPFLGYGFAAFWGTESIEKLVQNDQIEWAATASHSHNGYLDTALTMGFTGLALAVIVLIVMPLRNFSVAAGSGNDGRLARLFLRIWLFGIYLASMESFLLDRANPIWFTFLLAVVGLHYISRFRMMPA